MSPNGSMNRYFAITIALAGSCLQPLAGQDLRPKAPLLSRMPERSAWVLTFGKPSPANTGAADQSKNPTANRISITKNATTYRVVSDKPIGGFHEAWVIGSTVYLIAPDNTGCVIADMTSFPETNFSRSDFELFEWISDKNFSGVTTDENAKFFAFETNSLQRTLSAREASEIAGIREALRGEDPSNPAAVPDESVIRALGWAGTIKATLDVQRQRPVLLESGDLRVQVQILPDAETLTIPPVIRERLDRIAKENQALEKRPTRPGR